MKYKSHSSEYLSSTGPVPILTPQARRSKARGWALATLIALTGSFTLGGLAGAAEVPFLGSFSGSAQRFSLTASATATHLGEASATFITTPLGLPRFFSRLAAMPEEARSKVANLSSADGAALLGVIIYDSYDPVQHTVSARLIVTGGTRRFERASGAITVLFDSHDLSLNDFDCELEGTLALQQANGLFFPLFTPWTMGSVEAEQ